MHNNVTETLATSTRPAIGHNLSMKALRVKLTYNSRAITGFNRTMRSQVPYATARALTNVAKQSQDQIKADLPKRFIIRNAWTARGIIIQRAEKRDWPRAFAIVGSRDDYMIEQETGDARKPGRKAFSIPKGIRSSVKQLVRRSKWPGAILGPGRKRMPMGGRTKGSRNGIRMKPKPFLATMSNGKTGLFIRTGKPTGKPKRQKLKLLYAFQSRPINISSRHWLEQTVDHIAARALDTEFAKALENALATMK